MLMKVEPLRAAIEAARRAQGGNSRTLHLTPQGKRLDQSAIDALVQAPNLILIAGRYEGVDERVVEVAVDEEWSIGDYVLSGGELPAMVLIDALVRRIPGVLGHESSGLQDSFSDGLLDCPHYTRPEIAAGVRVPAVLLSGDHEAIRRWRLKQSLGRTWRRRPDLLDGRRLDGEQRALLDEFIAEQNDD
jgi:tRNA (guanine37-N1)-methyltransferase